LVDTIFVLPPSFPQLAPTLTPTLLGGGKPSFHEEGKPSFNEEGKPSGGWSPPWKPSGGWSPPWKPSGGWSSPWKPSGGWSPPWKPSGGWSPQWKPRGGWSPPRKPSGGKPNGAWSPPHGPPNGSWSPPAGFFPTTAKPTSYPTTTLEPTFNFTETPRKPSGGWSPSHDDHHDGWNSHGPVPGGWKPRGGRKRGEGWGSKSAKPKTAKSSSRPMRWIPASGVDWLSYGWDTSWGSDGDSEDFSWGGKWGRYDSTSSGDRFKWDRPIHGKTSKSKSSKNGGWDSAISMSYGSNDWWNAGVSKAKSSKKGNAAMSYGNNNDWWTSATSATNSLPGGVWVDPAWQVSKGSDSSISSPSQSHQSSKKSGSSSTSGSGGHILSSKPISSISQNGHQVGQSGKGHEKSSSGKGSDPASHNYSPTESTQSTKSSKSSDPASHNYSPTESTQSTKSSKSATVPVQIKKTPTNSSSQSEEISMEDKNKIKYWAEKKWQNTKLSEKSAGVRVGPSSCPTSRLLLLISTLATPILLGFTLC
jgi:hypothetical protein